MTLTCPKGHRSEDPEFCSECGVRMQGAAAPPQAPATVETCPACDNPRTPGARYCEACQYDFQGGSRPAAAPAKAPPPPAQVQAEPAPAPTVTPAPTAAPAPAAASVSPPASPPAAAALDSSPFYGRNAWARVAAVAELASPEEAADFPQGEVERAYPLDFAENLVGRRNGRAGVHPDVPVNDRAVSARHLKLCRRPEGMVLIDLDSTNGTRVNGTAVEAGVEVPVAPGDRIEIGGWTRIVLEAR